MPATFLLPEDPADTDVAFLLPKNQAPYVRALYDELKRDDETLDDFICRRICDEGSRVAMQKKIAQTDAERADASRIDHIALAQEYTDLVQPD